jgi:tetratricopeptide (TPR) repeat protein
MPKRVAADAIHTEMTDHQIARRPQFVNPLREQDPPRGPVIGFYTDADRLSLDFANLRDPNLETYRAYLKRDPGNEPVMVALGNAWLRLKQPREAAEVLGQAVRLNPRDTDALTYFAVAEAVQGNRRKALEILQRAVAGNPDHALSRINLGITHEALGELTSALADYDEAIRLQPDSSEARHRRNTILQRLRR